LEKEKKNKKKKQIGLFLSTENYLALNTELQLRLQFDLYVSTVLPGQEIEFSQKRIGLSLRICPISYPLQKIWELVRIK